MGEKRWKKVGKDKNVVQYRKYCTVVGREEREKRRNKDDKKRTNEWTNTKREEKKIPGVPEVRALNLKDDKGPKQTFFLQKI